ncbi:hypothetical protein J3456_15890 [Sulfitobacter sp. NFXS29]
MGQISFIGNICQRQLMINPSGRLPTVPTIEAILEMQLPRPDRDRIIRDATVI